jgi:hypothetical protein
MDATEKQVGRLLDYWRSRGYDPVDVSDAIQRINKTVQCLRKPEHTRIWVSPVVISLLALYDMARGAWGGLDILSDDSLPLWVIRLDSHQSNRTSDAEGTE